MGSTGEYLAFLAIGVVLVVIDGQLIMRSGRQYLRQAYGPEASAAAPITRLVVVLFHLIVLGVLALISAINFGGSDPLVRVVSKLGIILLLIAAAHGLTIAVLTRIRERQRQLRLLQEVTPDEDAAPEIEPEPVSRRLIPRSPHRYSEDDIEHVQRVSDD
ncbi:DUF2157 domain-containing protein [Fodinicola acaciae]|uniref:DUF2157 domain-containing protein n=1 Tax=Fodinicola acaciae TaxID=2681555 RepID=UPI0013D26C6B|nr:DUF2157 domain-containing protein [Fodinicola acaciae]